MVAVRCAANYLSTVRLCLCQAKVHKQLFITVKVCEAIVMIMCPATGGWLGGGVHDGTPGPS